MEAAPLYREFFGLWLAVNRRLDSITNRLGPPLTIYESHVLTALSGRDEPPTAQQVCKLVQMDKSAVSRIVNGMIERGLVIAGEDPHDRRARPLTLTAAGREILARDARARNEQVSQFAQRLSTRAQSELVLLLRQMADNLDASSLGSDREEHPLKEQLRRLTRAFGFLANDLFFSGVTLQECQVLHMLSGVSQGVALSSVIEGLPYERTRLSRIITNLQDGRFLRRVQSTVDRRQFVLLLEPAGVERLAHVMRKAGDLLARAFSTFSDAQLEQLRSLLEQVVDVEMEGIVNSIGPGTGIALVGTERERRLARGFLLEQLVRRGAHFDAPESFVTHRGKTFVLYRLNAIVALVEFQHTGAQWQAVHFVELPHAMSDLEIWTFIAEAFRELFAATSLDSVEVLSGALAERLRELPPFGEHSDDALRVTPAAIAQAGEHLNRLVPDA